MAAAQEDMERMAQRQANVSRRTWFVLRDASLTLTGDERPEDFYVIPEIRSRDFIERARWHGADPQVIYTARPEQEDRD